MIGVGTGGFDKLVDNQTYVLMRKMLFAILMLTVGMLPLVAQVDSSLTEGWESGDFSRLSWERPGMQYRWEVTSEGAHSGRYCVRSGNYYTLNTESVLQLAVYLTDSGTLSYYRKVFSAEGSGGFLFWLDGELRDSLAGYVEWSQFQCPVSAGFHTLKFCYTKNQTKSRGSDCVWIDDISLPSGITATPTPNDSTGNTEEVVIADDVEGHVYGTVNSPGSVGWSYIDGDAAPTATYNLLDFPNEGTPMAYVVLDDYLLAGNYYNVTAHSGNKFFGSPYRPGATNDDTAAVPIATGNHFTTPVLYDTTTYYLEARYQDDTLLCVSPRSAVTVYVIDTTASNSIFEIQNSELKLFPNPRRELSDCGRRERRPPMAGDI